MIPSVADALAAVPHTPALRVPQVVNLQRLEAAINGCQQPQLRQAMLQTLNEMLKSNPTAFRSLQGARRLSGFRARFSACVCRACSSAQGKNGDV